MKNERAEVTLDEGSVDVEYLCEGPDPDVGIDCGLCVWRVDGKDMTDEENQAAAEQIGCPCREASHDD